MISRFEKIKRLIRNLFRIKKIYRISLSLSILLLITVFTTISFFIIDLRITKNYPIGFYEYSENIHKNNFYNEIDLTEKVSIYRNKYRKEVSDNFRNDEFKEYKIPKVSYIKFIVDTVHDIDETSSTIIAGGYIEAFWQEKSIQKFNLPSKDIFYDKTKNDLLSTSVLNFYDAENQSYQKIILDESQIDGINFKHSKYRFKGRFRLYRDLRRFPFEHALLRITLTNPIAAPDINLLTDRESKIISPIFRINSYRFKKNLCNINDEKQLEKLSCTYDELKPVYSIGDSFKTINNLSDDFIDKFNELDYVPVAVLSGFLQRSSPSSFFRYIVPLMFGIIALALTDQLTSKYLEIRISVPATILLTFIFMHSGYQSEFPQLSYITFMDKLYYLAYLLAVLDLANAILISKPRNNINKLIKSYLKINSTTFIRSLFALLAVFGPFILYLTT